jgi:hypothetical protein
LAWAILALAAHGRAVESLISSLFALPDLSGNDDTCTLALVFLAADHDAEHVFHAQRNAGPAMSFDNWLGMR